jgi:light-regulated signal transduction histidine kinase (bacteriophytochrome)
MSPIHGQYIKNSGASSSFSVSIIIDDYLWGWLPARTQNPNTLILKIVFRQEFLRLWLPMPTRPSNQKRA